MNTPKKKILVVGGTGMLGRPVALKLQESGHEVNVLSRDIEKAKALFEKEINIVEGDLSNPESIEKAMEGCYGVHINLMGGPTRKGFDEIEHKGSVLIAKLAARQGLQHLTYLSGAPVHPSNFIDPGTKAKYDAEKGIKKTGIVYTIFRATWMMESLDLFIRGSKAMIIGKQPHKVNWVAADDFGEMVARTFDNRATFNKTFYVFGPEAYSKPEALEIYLRESRSKAKLTFLPLGLMKILAALSFNSKLKADVRRMAFYNKIGDNYGSRNEADKVFGPPKTTLIEWSRRSDRILRKIND